MPKNGLKIFEKFEGIFLEARVGPEAEQKFHKIYGSKTGDNATDNSAFSVRKNNGWTNGIDVRAYFEAPMWVVENLRKLGYRIVKRQIIMDKYKGGLRQYTWKVCNAELFWYLVDYGYKIGENKAIAFDIYLVRKHLKNMRYKPIFDINQIESENVVYEARLLAS